MVLALRDENLPRSAVKHWCAPASQDWQVLPEHYAVCRACGELPPCHHGEYRPEGGPRRPEQTGGIPLLVPEGCCMGCAEQIKPRMRTVRFPGPNLWYPDLGDDTAVFHSRSSCEDQVEYYRAQWQSEYAQTAAHPVTPAFPGFDRLLLPRARQAHLPAPQYEQAPGAPYDQMPTREYEQAPVRSTTRPRSRRTSRPRSGSTSRHRPRSRLRSTTRPRPRPMPIPLLRLRRPPPPLPRLRLRFRPRSTTRSRPRPRLPPRPRSTSGRRRPPPWPPAPAPSRRPSTATARIPSRTPRPLRPRPRARSRARPRPTAALPAGEEVNPAARAAEELSRSLADRPVFHNAEQAARVIEELTAAVRNIALYLNNPQARSHPDPARTPTAPDRSIRSGAVRPRWVWI
ncbi:hypothetical protein O1L60_19510 [Streptomyces diastatochromogenes]|nr:hypothetical protein [Streptomyces diastatochromogenes]